MYAILLAAGRGKRMRPLSDHTPKPLLTIAGKPLIVYHIEKLAKMGVQNIIINVSHLPEKFTAALGDGSRYGVNLEYSYEDPALETGGGIVKVLPQLGSDPFLAISGDIFTDFPLEQLSIPDRALAHLVLVDNPPHHLRGDYALLEQHYVTPVGQPLFNFAGIGIYRPALFHNSPQGAFRLPDLFPNAFAAKQITGEYYKGIWHNIGTAQQLEALNQQIALGEVSFNHC